MLKGPLLLIYGGTVHYVDPAKRFEASDGGFGSRWEITYQEIDFGPERLDPLFEQFSGDGRFFSACPLIK